MHHEVPSGSSAWRTGRGADATLTEMSREQTSESGHRSDRGKGKEISIYDDFDSFLKVGIREYYDRGWSRRKGNFIALLIASGQTAFALAKDSMVGGGGTKKLAIGAAAVVALQIGLRYALGGPLGLVLTVAAGASMVSYFVRNQKDIIRKVGVYKTLIKDTHERYEEAQGGWRNGKYDIAERNLMVDGLMKRFIEQVDET